MKMKSTPFMLRIKVPVDICEGDIHTDTHTGEKFRVTKIKSIKFLDMRTMQVIGLSRPVEEENNG